jgi:hypothetical protein
LEKDLQILYLRHKSLLKENASVFDLRALRMQIKQAEESLRLNKRIHALPVS